jgi:CO/xanthine dehydrogenase FAD-binding subunit
MERTMSLDAHPTLPEFEYIKPESLAEASQFLAAHAGEARPMMGGTDVFVRMRDAVWCDRYLVDIKGLGNLQEITYSAVDGLVIGAAVNMNRVIAFPVVREHYPVLAQAAESCASYQLRTRATIAGNICNASPAGDTIGACLLLGGVLDVHGIDGMRQEPLSSFFRGPGKSALRPGDIVTCVRLLVPPKGMQGTYIKLGRNQLGDLAIVGITVVGWPDGRLRSGCRVRLALASVAPIPLVVNSVEAMLADNELNERTIAEAAQLAMFACNPIDDVRASARYRKYMVRNLSARGLTEVWQRLKS